jgi:hypothetical protein
MLEMDLASGEQAQTHRLDSKNRIRFTSFLPLARRTGIVNLPGAECVDFGRQQTVRLISVFRRIADMSTALALTVRFGPGMC